MLNFLGILSGVVLRAEWPGRSVGEEFRNGALLVLDFPIIVGAIPALIGLGFSMVHYSSRWVLIVGAGLLGWLSLGYLWPQSSPTDGFGLPLGIWWRILFLPGVGAILGLALLTGFRPGPVLCGSLASLVGFCLGNLTGWFSIRGPGVPPDAGMAGSIFTFACAFVLGAALGIRLKAKCSKAGIRGVGAGLALLAIFFLVWMSIRCVSYYRADNVGAAWLSISMRCRDYCYFYWSSVR